MGQIAPRDSWAWQGMASQIPRFCSAANCGLTPSLSVPNPLGEAANTAGGTLARRPRHPHLPHGARDAAPALLDGEGHA